MSLLSLPRRVMIAVFASLMLAAPACADFKIAQPQLRTEPLSVATSRGRINLTVEIADTGQSRERGLMFRPSPKVHEGMLFDFKHPQEVAFWMKNTMVPLDIIFIAPNGKILNIARQAVPYSEEALPSAGAAMGVLEIAGGRSDELGIREGDIVTQRIFGPRKRR